MKSPKIFTSFLLLALIITGGGVTQRNQLGSQARTITSPLGIKVAITPKNLQFLDFHFTSIDPTDPQLIKAIAHDQAVKSTLEFEPHGKNATSISTQVGYFNNIDAIDLQNHRLVLCYFSNFVLHCIYSLRTVRTLHLPCQLYSICAIQTTITSASTIRWLLPH